MKLSFRYFGIDDPIKIEYVSQIPNIYSVVTTLTKFKADSLWNEKDLKELYEHITKHGLKMEVIESIPIHEDIKLGKPSRDKYIEIFIENLKLCSKYGVKCVCYNFMPVFDWVRTSLTYKNNDDSISLIYDAKEIEKLNTNNLSLPGWNASYSKHELKSLIDEYKDINEAKLFANLVYFLKKVIPIAEKYDVKLAIHPDDPPYSIFGLPRIINNKENLLRLMNEVPSTYNGLTLCVASLAESPNNDIYDIIDTFSKMNKIHFVHLRNIKLEKGTYSFKETSNETCDGDIDMAKIVSILVDNGFDGYVRPDHGRMIFGENGKPGYGLYDRALGCAYINGLFEMKERLK